MELEAGRTVLDRYVVESVLGRGGMGVVYRARHARLGHPIALKALHRLGSDETARFEREAHTMATIRHPNVVTIFDYGMVDDVFPCIAMELVEGQNLRQRVADEGLPTWDDAARIAAGVLDGLSAIHAVSTLHRDLKPDNVIVCPGEPEVVKLIDLGIAKPALEDTGQLTRTGVAIGTPDFMAPEQFLGEALDGRVDVYACGLLLYWLTTGRLPFSAATKNAILRRLREEVAPPVAPADRPVLPPALVALVCDMLRIEPEGRPADARVCARRLRRLLAASTAGADPGAAAPGAEPLAEAILEPADNPVVRAGDTTGRAGAPPTGSPQPGSEVAGAPAAGAPSGETVAGDLTGATRFTAEGAPGSAAPGPGAAGTAPGTSVRMLVMARLPPSRLADRRERAWLSEIAGPAARAYTFGTNTWFTVLSAPSPPAAESGARRIAGAVAERYGAMGKVSWRPLGPGSTLSMASLTGAEALPAEFLELFEKLNAAEG